MTVSKAFKKSPARATMQEGGLALLKLYAVICTRRRTAEVGDLRDRKPGWRAATLPHLKKGDSFQHFTYWTKDRDVSVRKFMVDGHTGY